MYKVKYELYEKYKNGNVDKGWNFRDVCYIDSELSNMQEDLQKHLDIKYIDKKNNKHGYVPHIIKIKQVKGHLVITNKIGE